MLYFLPALLWACLIFALSVNAPPELPKFDLIGADKIGHLLAYCLLTCCCIWGKAKQAAWSHWHTTQMAAWAVLAALYGAALEGVQALTPHRSFDYADMLANTAGAALGAVALRVFGRKILRRE